MKRILFILAFFGIFGLSCSHKPNFVIEGSFKNGSKKILVLDRLDINQTVVVDSIKIKKNNSFRFTVYAQHPDIYVLRNSEGKIITLLPSPGEKLILEGDYSDFDRKYRVSGSQDSEFVRQLVEKLMGTRESLKKLEKEFAGNSTQDMSSDYINKQKEIIKDQRDFSVRFIVQHLNSLSSIYALYQKLGPDKLVLGNNRDIQYMKIVADSLSQKYPDIPFVKSFINDARGAERRYYSLLGLQKKLNTASVSIPDVELPDTQGKPLKLSSLKGKTVLLYFWSPLAENYRKQNQDVLQTYLNYKNRGFEVFAVGLMEDATTWANTIIFDRLTWINVIEQDIANSAFLKAYNVNNIPADFLINKEGEIVARDLYGAELKIWLDNIIK